MPDPTSDPASDPARMVIALCTCNGARYLPAQLASFEAQDFDLWDLWVSDDGSTDPTLDILQEWKQRWKGRHQVHVIKGPGLGAAANFMSLLNHPDLPPGPIALSDQDDVWHAHKLASASAGLSAAAPQEPVLYGAQSLHTDKDLRPIGPSRLPRRAPSFANALTQNIVSGHSMAMNPAALALVRRAGIPKGISYHDWWIYQLISGAGGRVLVRPEVVLSYRQHDNNVLGASRGIGAMLERVVLIFGGEYGRWIRANIAALRAASDCLTPEHSDMIARLDHRPDHGGALPGPARMLRLWRAGLHRQRRAVTLIFYLAAVLGRI